MAKKIIILISTWIYLTCVKHRVSAEHNKEKWIQMKRFYNWTEGIDTWEAPEEHKRNFVSYVTGYSFNGGPVVITELGKTRVRKYVDDGNVTSKENLYKRSEQLWYKTASEPSVDNSSDAGVVLILDMAGLKNSELLSPEASKFYLYCIRIAEATMTKVDAVYIVNLSFPGLVWTNLVRPIAGEFFGHAELLGIDKTRIFADLRKDVPKKFLPAWLGGVDNFVPLKMF